MKNDLICTMTDCVRHNPVHQCTMKETFTVKPDSRRCPFYLTHADGADEEDLDRAAKEGRLIPDFGSPIPLYRIGPYCIFLHRTDPLWSIFLKRRNPMLALYTELERLKNEEPEHYKNISRLLKRHHIRKETDAMSNEPIISQEDLDLLVEAKDTICDFCSQEDCSVCPVPRIVRRMQLQRMAADQREDEEDV